MADSVGKVLAICISEKRGTVKKPVERAKLIANWGMENDAHAGKWHRQISLLSYEKIEDFRKKGADVKFGDFGENIVVEGIDLKELDMGSLIHIGQTVLRLSQIGKKCHSHCEIYKRMNDCIMPREGVFAEVITGGEIKVGDRVSVFPPDKSKPSAAVISLSDRASRGEREDVSGPLAEEYLLSHGYDVWENILMPDDEGELREALIRLCDKRGLNLIITVGGTGFSERDITPEVTKEVCTKMADGISQGIRAYSLSINKRAMLSRGEAGIRGKSLIINLPGSPKAVGEILPYILPVVRHGIEVLTGTANE